MALKATSTFREKKFLFQISVSVWRKLCSKINNEQVVKGYAPHTLSCGIYTGGLVSNQFVSGNRDACSKKHFKMWKMQLIRSYLKTLVDQSQSPPSTGLQALCWMTDSLMPEKRIKNVIFHFYHMKAAQASFCNHNHHHREDCIGAFMYFCLDFSVYCTDTFCSVYV